MEYLKIPIILFKTGEKKFKNTYGSKIIKEIFRVKTNEMMKNLKMQMKDLIQQHCQHSWVTMISNINMQKCKSCKSHKVRWTHNGKFVD